MQIDERHTRGQRIFSTSATMGKRTLAQCVILDNLHNASLQVQAILLEVSLYDPNGNVDYQGTTVSHWFWCIFNSERVPHCLCSSWKRTIVGVPREPLCVSSDIDGPILYILPLRCTTLTADNHLKTNHTTLGLSNITISGERNSIIDPRKVLYFLAAHRITSRCSYSVNEHFFPRC